MLNFAKVMSKQARSFFLLPFLLSFLLFTFFIKSPPKPIPSSEPAVVQAIIIPEPTFAPIIKKAITTENSRYPAKRISEHQWTLEIAPDSSMATPQEIFEALNNYRIKQGKNTLTWNNYLADFAQKRALLFTQLDKLDDHTGFYDFIYRQNGLSEIGFFKLGENSSFDYKLSGVNLVEKVFAGDKPHDDNQLDPIWTHVGIGVSSDSTNIIFGS